MKKFIDENRLNTYNKNKKSAAVKKTVALKLYS